MAQIYLREIRTKVDERFVGIRPRGNKLKPVHMAGGEFRALIGKVYDTEKIKRLSYVVNAKGITPIGNELKEVYTMLTDDDAIESGIRKEDLETLRKAMQDILGADNISEVNDKFKVGGGYPLNPSDMDNVVLRLETTNICNHASIQQIFIHDLFNYIY